jgi:glycosyltransferase involved in cell wall biosynthesis
MSRIALVQNYDLLGGAEKSGLEQANLLRNFEVDIYAPKINRVSEIPGSIPFAMPKSFFKLSRSNRSSYLFALFSLFKWILFSKKIKLNNYDKVWFNGLKVFILHFPYLLTYKGDVYFHLRDYVVKNIVMKFVLSILVKRGVKLHIISNSNDIKDDFLKEYRELNLKIKTCYNPCLAYPKESSQKVKIISLASMLTPWKGVHMILDFIHLYHDELKSIGIEKINIFGDAIYRTDSGEDSYKQELYKIVKDHELNLVSFRGKVPTSEIYKETDLLIHSSIEKEPFGRIVLESMGSGVPVLSTGIGGTQEIYSGLEHLIFEPFDYESLFSKIKNLTLSDNRELIASLHTKYEKMSKESSESFIVFIEDGV